MSHGNLVVDTTAITAEVYAQNDKGVYYVKVAIPSLAMYINSITVRQSTKFDELWVQMPAFRIGSRWTKPLEFRGDSQLLSIIKDTVLRAVDAFSHANKVTDLDLDNIEEKLSEAIDKLNNTKPP